MTLVLLDYFAAYKRWLLASVLFTIKDLFYPMRFIYTRMSLLINFIYCLFLIPFLSLTSFAQPTLRVVGYYPFTGNAKDESGYNHHATVRGATLTEDRFGSPNSAYQFDGLDDFIIVNNSNRLNTFPLTITAWVKPERRQNIPAYYGNDAGAHRFPNNVVSNDSPHQYGHGFGVNVWEDGAELVAEYNDGFSHFPLNTLEDKWYFVAVSYNQGMYSLYLNGNLLQAKQYDQGPVDGLNHILIGRHNDDVDWGGKVFFKGVIDEVTIYGLGLDNAQIKGLYRASSIPPVKEAVVSGRVFDRDTRKPLSKITLSAAGKKSPLQTLTTSENGQYAYKTPINDASTITIWTNGYEPLQQYVTIDQATVMKDLYLIPIKADTPVPKPDSSKSRIILSGKVIDAKTRLAIPKATLILLADERVEKPTNEAGAWIYAVKPTTQHVFSVSARGYKSAIESVKVGTQDTDVTFELTPDVNPVSPPVFSGLKKGDKINLTIQFQQSTPEILKNSMPRLQELLVFMQNSPTVWIELTGHTDNEGDYQKNLELSAQRVEVIKRYLVNGGIDKERVSGTGYGSMYPVAPNNTEANKAKNRRVEMTIIRE